MDETTQIWYASGESTHGGVNIVHTDRDCSYLNQSEKIIGPKPRKKQPDNWRLCRGCADDESAGGGPRDLHEKLKESGPEDIGLPPIGEKNA